MISQSTNINTLDEITLLNTTLPPLFFPSSFHYSIFLRSRFYLFYTKWKLNHVLLFTSANVNICILTLCLRSCTAAWKAFLHKWHQLGQESQTNLNTHVLQQTMLQSRLLSDTWLLDLQIYFRFLYHQQTIRYHQKTWHIFYKNRGTDTSFCFYSPLNRRKTTK